MKAFEKLIEKAMARTQGMPPREQWASIQQQVEVFFDIFEDGGAIGYAGTAAEKSAADKFRTVLASDLQQVIQKANPNGLILLPGRKEDIDSAVPVGPPVRIVYAGGPSAGDEAALPVEHWLTLDALVEEVRRVMPTVIELDLPGFAQPLKLNRKITPGPPVTEGVKFLRLQYLAEGAPDGPGVLCKTSDSSVDVQSILSEIQAGAVAQFSATQRKVEPRTPYVRPPSLDELRRMMPSSDPGPGKDEERAPHDEDIVTDRNRWDRYAK
jgi:hypothetical protein